MKKMYVYIITNYYNTVLYTGVTNNIFLRVSQHSEGKGSIFTNKYRCIKLIYVEVVIGAYEAIKREKQIKKWSRKKKEELIHHYNPTWKNLYNELSNIL